jgi:hypothetical protein
MDLDAMYFGQDNRGLQAQLQSFPLTSITNAAGDLAKVAETIKGGFKGKVEPTLLKLYSGGYKKALNKHFSGIKEGDAAFDLVSKFDANTERVAAYKAYHCTKELKALDAAADTYDAHAKMILRKYNRWQAAEYNTIVARSRTARQFSDWQSDAEVYPNMEWLMTRSADPREEHLELVGTILPMDDPFWDSNQPGNLWNCKCDWQPTSKEATKSAPDGVTPGKGLDGNPAKTGELITDKHPYISAVRSKKERGEIESAIE